MDIPARHLVGHELDGGWKVVKRLDKPPDATGGQFSFSYVVRDQKGHEAFLKALDFSHAFLCADPVLKMMDMTTAYEYERGLHRVCNDARMKNVATVLEEGYVEVDETSLIGKKVPYLIFELADGDLRDHLRFNLGLALPFAFRILHNSAAGLDQLHGKAIAHQDLKPSNVLVSTSTEAKVGDLGSASQRGAPAPRDHLPIAGDPQYAPPEALYDFRHPEWSSRHFGCDAYLLGSLAVFVFTGTSMTSLLLSHLDVSMHPINWVGTFDEVLPPLHDAFAKAIVSFESALDYEIPQLVTAVSQLGNPDPSKRGHPKAIQSVGHSHSLERYVSLFDQLAKKARFGLIKRVT